MSAAQTSITSSDPIVNVSHRWSEQQMFLLRKMAMDDKSASVIAAAIGKSRNSVIGRCDRLKIRLGGRPRCVKNKPSFKTPVAKRNHREVQNGINSTSGTYRVGRDSAQTGKADSAVVARVLDPTNAPAGALMLTLMEIGTGQCRWPFEIESEFPGQKPQIKFCGCPVTTGASWCAVHAKRAFAEKQTGNGM